MVPPPDPVGEAIGQGPIVDEVATPPGPDHGAPLLGVPPVRATPLITPCAVEEPAKPPQPSAPGVRTDLGTVAPDRVAPPR